MADLIEPAPPMDLTQAPLTGGDEDDAEEDIRLGSSAKIEQLINLLRLTPSAEKSLVFSQFTSFLDKVWVISCVAEIPLNVLPPYADCGSP